MYLARGRKRKQASKATGIASLRGVDGPRRQFRRKPIARSVPPSCTVRSRRSKREQAFFKLLTARFAAYACERFSLHRSCSLPQARREADAELVASLRTDGQEQS